MHNSETVPSPWVIIGCIIFLAVVIFFATHEPMPKKKMVVDAYVDLLLQISKANSLTSLLFMRDKCDDFYCRYQDKAVCEELYIGLLSEIDEKKFQLNITVSLTH